MSPILHRPGRRSGSHITMPALMAVLALVLLVGPATGQDQVGIYWDEAFTQNQISVPTPFSSVTGHIVIHDPSAGGGILAWECEVDITGPAQVTAWNIAGQAINAASPPRFAVGLATPLPPAAATAVASFDLIVMEVAPVQIGLKPLYFASIPGEMAYIGGDDPEQLVAMTTVSGVPTVATVNADIPVAEVNRLTIRFGEIIIGGQAMEQVEVTNVGGGILSLDIALDCVDPGFWLASPAGPVDLAAGQSVTATVRFSPVAVGTFECTLILGGGAPDIGMLGFGRAPISSWTEPDDVDFGAVPIGATATRSVSLRNTGETVLAVDVQWLTNCDGFEIISGGGPATLQPGYFHNVSLRFAPTAPENWDCNLSFGPGLPEVNVSGSSIWSTPSYSISPSRVDFPVTDVGASRVQVVEVANTGTASFSITPSIAPANPAFSVRDDGLPVIITPGSSHLLPVSFTPPAEQYYSADLSLGSSLPALSLTGTGGQGVLMCQVSEDTLDFNVPGIGDTQSKLVVVQNLGNVGFDLSPIFDRPQFSLGFGVPSRLQPGESADVRVTFTADSLAPVTATLVLGPAVCSAVTLVGGVDIGIDPGTNQIGFFFDPGFTALETGVDGPGATLPVFLALVNPANTSGVAGWECRVAIGGEAMFTNVELAGNAINVANPNNVNEYVVGIGLEPLPWTPDGVLLATFDLLVTDPDPTSVYLQLHPIYQASLTGLMAWLPWNSADTLTPMVPITGQPTVAWITDGPVGTGAPTPRAVQTGGTVELAWTTRLQDLDGYHVERRGPDGHRERLTTTLLPASETVTFSDRPEVPAGTTLRYRYVAVKQGAEVAVSPEVTVQVAGVPAAHTGLLANVPNPFNPETRVRYRLAQAGQVRVTVYDVTGRLVRTLVAEHRSAGEQDITWRGRDDAGRVVSSGAYYVRLETADGVDHRKVMMLK